MQAVNNSCDPALIAEIQRWFRVRAVAPHLLRFRNFPKIASLRMAPATASSVPTSGPIAR